MLTHRPRKPLGQHFLTDSFFVASIIALLGLYPDDTVVEIGPGTGALTGPMLTRLPHLHAIELDRVLCQKLSKHYGDRLTLHHHDATTLPLDSLSPHPIRLVGNLPYNRSSALLLAFFQYAHCFKDLHIMLQKEVAQRVCAEPNSKAYGRLSVLLQTRFHPQYLLDIPPEAFCPPPQVQSSVICLTPTPAKLPEAQMPVFSQIVKQAFSQRRKKVYNTLKQMFSSAELASLGIEPNARAENLSIETFIQLSQHHAHRAAK